MFALLTYGLAFCFSAVLPFSILSLRRTVRLRRQEVILDLQQMFELDAIHTGEEAIIPSFEFVKYKYFPRVEPKAPAAGEPGSAGAAADDAGAAMARANAAALGKAKGRAPDADASILTYFVCSLPLVLLVFAFSVLAISVILAQLLTPGLGSAGLPPFRHMTVSGMSDQWMAGLWVFIVAFLGGYLFAVRGLLRAVNNFDLTPGSFVAAALQMLLGVASALVIMVGGLGSLVSGEAWTSVAVPGAIVVAFIIGFIPEFGLRTLYRSSKLLLFKIEDSNLYQSFKATPVEVIDGIDTEIRSRLAELNIVSVQNLATANPIMLFVETPYGIYQSIDWVAQAQLCAAVGPHAVLRLWKLGIRTIFDLEKAVLVPGYTTPRLRQAVGRALLADADPATQAGLAAEAGAALDDDTIVAVVDNTLDDLHVHRLRQITNRIRQRLGAENNLFQVRCAEPALRAAANDRQAA